MACVVAIPDADQTPEMVAGLAPGLAAGRQFARRLAENGCEVLVPVLLDRQDPASGNPRLSGTPTSPIANGFIARPSSWAGISSVMKCKR